VTGRRLSRRRVNVRSNQKPMLERKLSQRCDAMTKAVLTIKSAAQFIDQVIVNRA